MQVLDGSDAGKSATTDSSGNYRFEGLAVGNKNFAASASGGYGEDRRGVYVNGANTLDFTLATPLFSRSGTGDNVFDIPSYVKRIRVTGRYTGYSSNFIVHINGRGWINELLGTGWSSTVFDGTYTSSGGTVEILYSNGVSWTFTEVR